jgi:hypothetical protein
LKESHLPKDKAKKRLEDWKIEVRRNERLEQKAKDKAGNGKRKMTNVQDEVTSIVLDEVS